METQAEKERAAIDAGYWFAKNGKGLWVIGRGMVRINAPRGYGDLRTRLDARKAMVAAWEASKWNKVTMKGFTFGSLDVEEMIAAIALTRAKWVAAGDSIGDGWAVGVYGLARLEAKGLAYSVDSGPKHKVYYRAVGGP